MALHFSLSSVALILLLLLDIPGHNLNAKRTAFFNPEYAVAENLTGKDRYDRAPESDIYLRPEGSSKSFLEKTIITNDEKVHGVVIATVTSSHEELVLKSLNAGKAVFCEKPLAETYDGTANCYNLSQSKGHPLLCAFNRRFDPTHCKVRDQVRAGIVGQVQIIKTCSRDAPFPPVEYLKVSHGMFHDCGIHDMDLIMWILEEKPIVVSCFGHAFRKEVAELNDVDTVAVTLKFPSGALALIDLSRHATYGYDQRLEVFGSEGMVQSKNPSASAISVSNGKGVSDDMLESSFTTRYQDAYRRELDHFLDAISGGDVRVRKEETLAACKVAQACEDSFKFGLPVQLQWA